MTHPDQPRAIWLHLYPDGTIETVEQDGTLIKKLGWRQMNEHAAELLERCTGVGREYLP